MLRLRRTVSSKRFFKQLLAQSVAPAVLAAALAAPSAYAQQTTSSISGQVLTAEGAPAAGIKVVITHTPSGTTATAISDSAGHFAASGLRVGGPYTVRFEPTSGKPEVVEDVFLKLGEPFVVSVNLKPAAAATEAFAGEEIVVSGSRDAKKLVSQATFDRDSIENAPTVSRDLKDIIKQDPRVLLDPTNGNAIQIVGTSNRFNSLTIDGIQANDDFGLNANGYPTHHSPIPLDAIDQLAVVIAPFDVDYDGFMGGMVNIVTKSGTNDLHGSVYEYYSNDKLSGQTSGHLTNLIPHFQTRTKGLSAGFPIIPDKLFFFGAIEDYRTVSPATYGTTDGQGGATVVPGVSSASVNSVISAAQSKYGYNAGSIVSSTPEFDRTAIAKVDWNVTDDHRVSFTYEESETNQILDGSSSSSGALYTGPASSVTAAPLLALSSDFYTFKQLMNNYALQEFSDWTPQFSTQFEIGRKDVSSLRDPLNGSSIGQVNVITPGGGAVVFGPDISSQSNKLFTETDTYKLKAKYQLDDHAISGGYERFVNDYNNLFIQRTGGQWWFSSVSNFQNGIASRFQYSNAYTNNPEDGAAIWNYAQDNFYAQDRWDITEDITVQAGLRYERYSNNQTPHPSALFQSLYGFSNTANLDGRDLVLPRIGYNWKVLPDTTLHGGFGQFSTLGPAVWISDNLSNDGFTVRSLTATSGSLLTTNTLGVPAAAVQQLNAISSPTINALDPNFKIPSSYRGDFAVDHKFEGGPIVSMDLLYSKVAEGINYQDLRLIQIGSAPDGRPIYGTRAADPRSATSSQDIFLTNTTKGDSFNASINGRQSFETEVGTFDLTGGYSYTQGTDVNPGTSSVAASNFKTLALSNVNNPGAANSNYVSNHVITAAVTWTERFFDDAKTSLSLLGTLRSGLPYSFTFACTSNNPFGDSACGVNGYSRELFYVPTGPNDPKVNWAASSVTPAQMSAYVSKYDLGKYAGQIAPRNAFYAPWFETLDLHFLQELPSPIDGHKLQFTVDTINLSNAIFPSWGRLEQVAFPGFVPVTGVKIVNNQYAFTSSNLTGVSQSLSARASIWQIQLGLHYSF